MKTTARILAAGLLTLGCAAVHAQDPVKPAADVEKLFTSPDPILNKNKQAAYHITKDLLEAGRWDEADKWLTKRYIQHNPQADSGLDGVVYFFTKVLKVTPKPVPVKAATPVVSVVAEGDIVMVSKMIELKDPKDPTRSYTTTWFDAWRFVDGKADEHWDPATKK